MPIPQLFPRLLQIGFASTLSFALGAMTGAISSYVTIRSDAAALTARVVIAEQRASSLEQSVTEWRADDERIYTALSGQVKDAVDILTELRIRFGPPGVGTGVHR